VDEVDLARRRPFRPRGRRPATTFFDVRGVGPVAAARDPGPPTGGGPSRRSAAPRVVSPAPQTKPRPDDHHARWARLAEHRPPRRAPCCGSRGALRVGAARRRLVDVHQRVARDEGRPRSRRGPTRSTPGGRAGPRTTLREPSIVDGAFEVLPRPGVLDLLAAEWYAQARSRPRPPRPDGRSVMSPRTASAPSPVTAAAARVGGAQAPGPRRPPRRGARSACRRRTRSRRFTKTLIWQARLTTIGGASDAADYGGRRAPPPTAWPHPSHLPQHPSGTLRPGRDRLGRSGRDREHPGPRFSWRRSSCRFLSRAALSCSPPHRKGSFSHLGAPDRQRAWWTLLLAVHLAHYFARALSRKTRKADENTFGRRAGLAWRDSSRGLLPSAPAPGMRPGRTAGAGAGIRVGPAA